MSEDRNNKAHARGALLGLAVGDAFGTTLEFKRFPEVPWSPLLAGPHTNVIGGGPFGVLPGQVTDDTMMAACLAASLRQNGGLDPEDVARRYVAWREVTFDCGSQTGQSLGAVRGGTPPDLSGKEVWDRGGRHAAGNGSLMRTAPIGVFFAGHLGGIVSASVLDSNITHFDPRCSLACAAYNAAVGEAVTIGSGTDSNGVAEGPTSEEMVEAAWDGLHMAAGFFMSRFPDASDQVDDALRDLKSDLTFSFGSDPHLYGPELHIHTMQGFVRVAFRLAFWELLHAPDYRSGLLDTVNRGGDSDTNGAIVGGLLGARYGEGSIPAEWKTTVRNCDPPAPFNKAGALHPDRLLELLDEVKGV